MNKIRYKTIDEKSKTITDGLGMSIDMGVRELVVLLNYNNIGTTQSCWGHKSKGLNYPWVDIHQEHLGELYTIISNLDIETEKISDTIRISPKTKNLIEGRKTFNKFKKKLKDKSFKK
jgi:hypothetical protein